MLIVELNNKELLNNNQIEAFLIGVEEISSECYHHFTLNEVTEIIKIIHNNHKKAYIDATMIFHDQDLIKAYSIISQLEKADGFFYNDLALMKKIPLDKRIYYSVTYTTNTKDFEITSLENHFVLVSPELSFIELKKFNDATKNLFICFGTWEIFHSRRPLLSNYAKYRGIELNNGSYEIIEEFRKEHYPIIEKNGTKIYLNKYYYLSKELEELKGNFLIKTFDLSLSEVKQIVEYYLRALKTNNYQLLDDNLKKLKISLHQGLLYEDSILVKEVKTRE